LIDVVPGLELLRVRVHARALDPVERCRTELAADELVDSGLQQLRVVREILRRLGASGEDDRREIVRAEAPFEEALHRRLHARGSREVGMHVVEHDEINAPLRMLVGLHVGLDGGRREDRPLGVLDRNVDE
jgi:hypothetical protein